MLQRNPGIHFVVGVIVAIVFCSEQGSLDSGNYVQEGLMMIDEDVIVETPLQRLVGAQVV